VPAILLLAVVTLVASVPAFADPIADKKAEAQRVLGEINQLDQSLGKAVEQYDAATVKLSHIRHELSVNKFEMKVALQNRKAAEARLAARLKQLYITGGQDSTLEVLLGAKSLDDVINRLDTANRVSDEDAQVLKEVKHYRAEVARSGAVLARAHRAQEQVVADRAAAKSRIENGLADRRRLLSSIHGEIVQLQQEEAARQAQLAAEARARLVQQQQEQQARLNSYSQVGVSLPHSSYALWNAGVYVSKDQLEPGDLVFFDGLGHVGIYIGGGQFIHAPHTGDVVKISNLNDGWYAATYVGARRIL